MANIGNQLSTNNFVCDTFSGTGSQTTFTPLTFAPASVASIAVFVGGSYQAPTTYSLSGTSLVFASAPTAGTGNIRVLHLGTGSVSQVPADGSVSNTKIYATGTANSSTFLRGDNSWAVVDMNSITGDLTVSGNTTINGTGFTKIATGTTAQRPTSNGAGYIRYNTTLGYPEWYDTTSGTWSAFYSYAPYNAQVLVVAGGGGGGGRVGGGGGAGGVVYNSAFSLTPGVLYTATVGSGGAGGTGGNDGPEQDGSQGNPSSFPGVTTAIGGGAGKDGNSGKPGGPGGSGGAGGYNADPGGSGTPGQGNPGGTSSPYGSPYQYIKAGGGGAGAAGSNWNPSGIGGPGGAGAAYSVSGSSVTYGGGGGGGTHNPANGAGSGGPGGGGAAGASGGKNAGTNGTTNLGGGGGGASTDTGNSLKGGNGGSGIIILQYAGGQKGSGGTITSSGGNTIHTFTSTGTFTG